MPRISPSGGWYSIDMDMDRGGCVVWDNILWWRDDERRWGDTRRADSYCTRVIVGSRIKICAEILDGKGRHCVYFGQVRSLLCACILTQVEEDNLANVSTSLSGSHIEDLTKTRVSNSKCFSKRFTPNRHNWNLILEIDKISDCIRIDLYHCVLLDGISILAGRRCQNSVPSSGFRRREIDSSLMRVFDLGHFFTFPSSCVILNASHSFQVLCKTRVFRLRAGYLIPGTALSSSAWVLIMLLRHFQEDSGALLHHQRFSINSFIHKILHQHH